MTSYLTPFNGNETQNHENGGVLMGRKYDFELRYLKNQLAHGGQ